MLSAEQRLLNMRCPEGPVDAVIDSDTYNEIDDQFAISYALRARDRIRLRALYAAPFTNERSTGPADGLEKSFREMHRLLSLAGTDDCPVFRGSEAYLTDEETPVPSPAARDLVRRAADYTPERPLYVVSIAAITNIASALLTDPG